MEPDRDVAIEFTGLRPGEKLVERLWSEEERLERAAHSQLKLVRSPAPERAALEARLEGLAQAVADHDEPKLVVLLRDALPEYTPGAGSKPA